MKRLSRRNMTGPRGMYYAVAPLSTAKGRLPIAAEAADKLAAELATQSESIDKQAAALATQSEAVDKQAAWFETKAWRASGC